MVAKELGISVGLDAQSIPNVYYYKLRGGHQPVKHKGIKYSDLKTKTINDEAKDTIAAKSLFKGLVDGYEKIIDKLEEMKKQNEDDYVINTIASIKLSAIKTQSGIINQCSSQYLTAIRDKYKDYRILDGSALAHISKKKSEAYEKMRKESKDDNQK